MTAGSFVPPRDGRVVALYREGRTIKKVAAEMEISTATVRRILCKSNEPTRKRGPRREAGAAKRAEIAAFYSDLGTLAAVAQRAGISKEYVRRILIQQETDTGNTLRRKPGRRLGWRKAPAHSATQG